MLIRPLHSNVMINSRRPGLEIIKGKEDGISRAKIAAMAMVSAVVTALGRALSPFVGDIVKELSRALKSNVDEHRLAVLQTFQLLIRAASNREYKDLFKCIKAGLLDKSTEVRVAAADCATAMAKDTNYLQTAELDGVVAAALKSLENSTYQVRRSTAMLFGALLSSALDDDTWRGVKSSKRPGIDDLLGLLAAGFLKADPIRSKEVRIGVAQVRAFLARLSPCLLL